MTEPTLHHLACPDPAGSHRMAWWQWGDAGAAHLVLCLHGLTRQGRDFDALARALLARAPHAVRVVCPDVVGRGRSDWLRDPSGYVVPQYAGDMVALLAQLQQAVPIGTLDIVGTSMGGLIGMVLAGQPGLPMPAPVRRLVLNDVGPAIAPAALERIRGYVGRSGPYATLEEAAQAMWQISSGFGPHTAGQWLALSRPMVVPASQRSPDGSARREGDAQAEGADATGGPFVLHYDPALGVPLRALTAEAIAQAEAAVWALYDAIRARTLLVRGAESDLLAPGTAEAMTLRGPRAQRVEFAGVGHAPTFVDPAQAAVVADFLFD